MAATCVSVSVGVVGAFASVRDTAIARQTRRLALAVPSLENSLGYIAPGVISSFGLRAPGSRAGRNADIAARAADLEQGLEELDSLDTTLSPPRPGTKIYVGNLPWTVDSQQLAQVFQGVGEVEIVEVIYDRETQRSRGFAFVTMSTEEDTLRAIERLDGFELDGRSIKVSSSKEGGFRTGERPARPYSPGGGGSFSNENKLFVGNLSWGVDDASLEQLFSDYGKVVEAKVIYDRTTGRSRGFGFVTLASSTEVSQAITSLDGTEFDGRTLRVNLAGYKPPAREPGSMDY